MFVILYKTNAVYYKMNETVGFHFIMNQPLC